MITTIIFSKDRPLQLDLCLKSIKTNLVGSDDTRCLMTITVIENYSEKYRSNLETLKYEHLDVDFIKQSDKNLFKCIRTYLSTKRNDFPVTFFTDDGILFKKIDVRKINQVMKNPNVVTYSMRMGTNINRRDHEGRSFADPLRGDAARIDENLGNLYWNKTSHYYGSYWSYSHSVDGHTFRHDDIFDWTDTLATLSRNKKIKCKTPNDYESALQMFWPLSGSLMVSPVHSCYVNSPNNRVSSNFESNMSGELHDYSPDYLLRKYMSGGRIDLNSLELDNINCPHTEIDILQGCKQYDF